MKHLAFILQTHPGIMILMGLVFMVILSWLFWPQKGLISNFHKIKLNNQRVQLEDALKYLFDCEYKNVSCNMNSLAGNLFISGDQASKLISKLLDMGLITMTDDQIKLTDTGRSYSLRIIRVHRVWERYLADETSVAQADWHKEADRLEHHVTMEATEKLAAQMGHPVYDPHGDPIPSSKGIIPDPKGNPLNKLEEGDIGYIIHIEDEPRNIYEQLVVQGLYPGMQVFVTDVKEEKITFAADGNEYTLTPLFASQITVEKTQEEAEVTIGYDLLTSLGEGEKAEVVGISPNCRGQQRRRLMDLGIVPGSVISHEITSPLKDPVGYRIMGATIGIRKQEGEMIFIKNLEKHGA